MTLYSSDHDWIRIQLKRNVIQIGAQGIENICLITSISIISMTMVKDKETLKKYLSIPFRNTFQTLILFCKTKQHIDPIIIPKYYTILYYTIL